MDESQFSEPTKRWLAQDAASMWTGGACSYTSAASADILSARIPDLFLRLARDHRPAFSSIAASPDFPVRPLRQAAAYSYSLFQQTDAIRGPRPGAQRSRGASSVTTWGRACTRSCWRANTKRELPFRILSSTFLNGSMLQGLATITVFQKLLSANETLPQAISFCTQIEGTYIPGLKSVMKKPECLSAEDETVLTETLAYQDGNRRLPALAVYMRERYLHLDRWIGALRTARTPVQFIWADGDPVATIELGRALHQEVPDAGYTELPGSGHFLLMEDPEAVAAGIAEFLALV
jgi:pimeloyl-ACP methyl ester carboxylesterase